MAHAAARSLKASGLPENLDQQELLAMFEPEDELAGLRVACDASGMCCGYAVLDFKRPLAAAKALARYNGRQIPGRKACLHLSASSARAPAPLAGYQICVGGLPKEACDADLFQAFGALSEGVVGARVPRIPDTGLSWGYGFVRMSTDEEALDLVLRAPSVAVLGRPLCVVQTFQGDHVWQHSGGPSGSDPDRSVMIKNLDSHIEESWLREFLGAFGEVDTVRVVGQRCFAFVTFKEHAAALGALSLLQDRKVRGRALRLEWPKAARRELPQAIEAPMSRSGVRFGVLPPRTRRVAYPAPPQTKRTRTA